MFNNLPDKVTDKVPDYREYKESPKTAVSYVFMLVFFIYFIYNEFVKEDDCGSRIVTLETVLKQKDLMINQLNTRVSILENALDTKNGVIKLIENKVDSVGVGGAK